MDKYKHNNDIRQHLHVHVLKNTRLKSKIEDFRLLAGDFSEIVKLRPVSLPLHIQAHSEYCMHIVSTACTET